MASTIAAGSAYATHGTPMIPIYIFYSMFGFQRTGDQMWAMGDQLGRGFLLGATAGRTTLTGEGLQHNDGHSLLLASTSPACLAYDAAWGYELATIVKDGLRRMYGSSEEHPDGESIFYYLALYNEPYVQPPSQPTTRADRRSWSRRSCAACTGTRRGPTRAGLAATGPGPGSPRRASRSGPRSRRSGCSQRIGVCTLRCGRRRPGRSCAGRACRASSGTCCTPTRRQGCLT